jgi:hypothetical protein
MAAELIVAPEAEQDIAEAYEWYEGKRFGLGEEFLSRVDACIQGILRNPNFTECCTRIIGGAWCGDSPTRSSTSMQMVWSPSIAFSTHRAIRRSGVFDFPKSSGEHT